MCGMVRTQYTRVDLRHGVTKDSPQSGGHGGRVIRDASYLTQLIEQPGC
jgi:hypothetical protein